MQTGEEASDLLNIPSATLRTTKYTDFRIRNEGDCVRFDIDAYKYAQEFKQQLKEQATLFIEYLYHIENIRYSDMSRKCGISIQHISQHNFSPIKAIRIALMGKYHYPAEFKRYHEYYNYKIYLQSPRGSK